MEPIHAYLTYAVQSYFTTVFKTLFYSVFIVCVKCRLFCSGVNRDMSEVKYKYMKYNGYNRTDPSACHCRIYHRLAQQFPTESWVNDFQISLDGNGQQVDRRAVE